jgi:hypothetical protein
MKSGSRFASSSVQAITESRPDASFGGKTSKERVSLFVARISLIFIADQYAGIRGFYQQD